MVWAGEKGPLHPTVLPTRHPAQRQQHAGSKCGQSSGQPGAPSPAFLQSKGPGYPLSVSGYSKGRQTQILPRSQPGATAAAASALPSCVHRATYPRGSEQERGSSNSEHPQNSLPAQAAHAPSARSQLGLGWVPEPKGRVGFCHTSVASLSAVLSDVGAHRRAPQFARLRQAPPKAGPARGDTDGAGRFSLRAGSTSTGAASSQTPSQGIPE